ncbi:hypothetical protein HYV83_01255 [Candidatus Woesearchaeota archaeon]|nr:hypothetical protein [Candidatus Woesearchaeota archaeon]
MVDYNDMLQQCKIALKLIEQAKKFEVQGQEENAIATYLRAGEEAVRGRLFDSPFANNPELSVFPKIWEGLDGRMIAIWEEHDRKVNAELAKTRLGLDGFEGQPVYRVE